MSRPATRLHIVDPPTPGEPAGRRPLRLAARWGALALAVACVLGWFPWPWAPMLPTALSPWVAAACLLATGALSISVLWGLPVLALAMLRHRWFCRYACPTGLLAECAGRLRRSAAPPATRLPHVGHWIALITLAGAAVGYPVLLWLDPLAIFTGFVGSCSRPAEPAARLLMAGLPLVLVVSLFRPGLWCLRICPLGATQELLALPKRWLRQTMQSRAAAGAAGCHGQIACPYPEDSGGQAAGGTRSPSRPELNCDAAEPRSHRGAWRLTRRVVLASALGAAWAAALVGRRKAAQRPLRPPGSVGESQFTGLCVRCGNCARVCPSKIIEPDVGDQGLAGFLAPVVRFRDAYCLEDCRRCLEVCPSGAIASLALEEKRRAPIGVARVDMEVCLLADDKECALCRDRCPYDAIQIVFSETDYLSTPVVDRMKCPGCGACEVVCPTSPVKAIAVVPQA